MNQHVDVSGFADLMISEEIKNQPGSLGYLLGECTTSEDQVMGKPRLDTHQTVSTTVTSNGVWKISWDCRSQGHGGTSKQRNGQCFLN